MITLGAGLLGVGLVIVCVFGTLSLAAGDQNSVAISADVFWLALASIAFGLFFVSLGVWRYLREERKDDRQPPLREDWRSQS